MIQINQKILRKYSDLFVKDYINRLSQKLNQNDDKDFINDALHAKRGITIKGIVPEVDELDRLEIWDNKGGLNEEKYNEYQEKTNDGLSIKRSRYEAESIKKE